MKDERKTKKELITELTELRRLIDKVEKKQAGREQVKHELQESEEREPRNEGREPRNEKREVMGDDRFRAISDTTQDSIFIKDRALKYTYVNLAMEKFFGLPTSRLIGLTDDDLFDKEAALHIREIDTRVINGEIVEEEHTKKIKGVPFTFHIIKGPMRNKSGEIIGLCGIARDVTEQKRAEEALKESEEKYRSIFEMVPTSIIVIDKEGRMIGINPYHLSNIARGKFTKDDFVGKSILTHPTIVNAGLSGTYKRVLEGEAFDKKDVYFPTLMPGDDGYFNAKGVPLLKDGEVIGAVIIHEDITERKRAEEALVESKNNYHSLFEFHKGILEHSPAGILRLDEKMKIIYENPEMKKLMGVPPGKESKAIGVDIRELPSIKKAGLADVFNGLSKGKDIHGECPFTSIYGKKSFLSFTLSPIFKGSEFAGANLLVIDITERKQMEDTLRESETKYRTLMENIRDGVFTLDTKGCFTFVNDIIVQRSGYIREWFNGKNYLDIIRPSDRKRMGKNFHAVMRGEEVPIDELAYPTASGGEMWVEVNTTPLYERGNIIGLLGISRDITERKRIEEALREREEEYRTTIDSMGDSIHVVDNDLRILLVNKAIKEWLSGLGMELELTGKKVFEVFPFLPDKVRDEYYKVFKDGKTLITQEHNKIGDREIITETRKIPVFEKDNVVKIVTVIRDITDRERVDREMRRRLMKFRLEEGNLYLVRESAPTLSIEAFKDLLNIGYRGVVITRTPKEELSRAIECDFTYIWLAEKGDEKALPPDPEKIEQIIEELHLKHVILIDRLDYLISKMDFKKTLSFVQHLREITYIKGSIVLLSIDPSTLSKFEIRFLEKEGKEIKPLHEKILSDKLFNVLKYIYRQNSIGLKPSYVDVGKELKISKPTVSKRISNIISTGYVREELKGRKKVIELTERGRKLFWK